MARLLVLLLALAACADDPAPLAESDADADGWEKGADCADDDPALHPGAPELCDGVDNDCNGAVDEIHPANDLVFHADADGDGFGNPGAAVSLCAAPEGFVADATDCDDTDPAIRPGAPEEDCADPVDYNCDGSVGHADADLDGAAACEDCDDADAAAFPGAPEVCDQVDNDCDSAADEAGALGELLFYRDADTDGFGDPALPAWACARPAGHVDNAADCDDGDGLVAPDGTEACNGYDDDCDRLVDEAGATGERTWFYDWDGDAFGDPDVTAEACAAPDRFVADDRDCDDTDPAVHPLKTWYLDDDGDTWGDLAVQQASCEAPDAYVDRFGDCDDGDGAVHPDHDEVCDGVDNDCDGRSDDDDPGLVGARSWFLDVDGDGFGSPLSEVVACAAPNPAFVPAGGDCDEQDTAIHPQADPVCDDVDHDCDGTADFDADEDGWSDWTCGGTDCDDADEQAVPEPGGGCGMGLSCADLHAQGLPTGLYTVDPDGPGGAAAPFDAWCEMELARGGWTLVATNTRDGDWTAATFRSTARWGTPSPTTSFKGDAFFQQPFTDLLFENGSANRAVYVDVGDGTEGFWAFQDAIAHHNCGSPSWPLFEGSLVNLGTPSYELCDTRLYMHPRDWDGTGSCTATSTPANATGPTWSMSRNGSCPLDDPSATSFIAAGDPWGGGTLRMYVR